MKTILIADDSASLRELVRMTLEANGYHVLVGTDGEDACTYLDGRDINLVITDLNMPRLDGIGVVAAVRAHAAYKTVPVLLLTTESQADKKNEAKAAGATGWIVKPFVPEKLVETVKRMLP